MSAAGRRRLDKQAKEAGWTHRKKNKKIDPYLKLQDPLDTHDIGATFVDQDQKYRWLNWDQVVDL